MVDSNEREGRRFVPASDRDKDQESVHIAPETTVGQKQMLIAEHLYQVLFNKEQERLATGVQTLALVYSREHELLLKLMKQVYKAQLAVSSFESRVQENLNFNSQGNPTLQEIQTRFARLYEKMGEPQGKISPEEISLIVTNVLRLLIENHAETWEILEGIDKNMSQAIEQNIVREYEGRHIDAKIVQTILKSLFTLYIADKRTFHDIVFSVVKSFKEDPHARRIAFNFQNIRTVDSITRFGLHNPNQDLPFIGFMLDDSVELFFQLVAYGQDRIREMIGGFVEPPHQSAQMSEEMIEQINVQLRALREFYTDFYKAVDEARGSKESS